MLPGFRVLLATILLSTSVLVFGLGAAALLRAAHKEFANVPSQRAPETTFAQRDDAEPTLAMLQIDAPAPSETAFAEPADEVQAEAAAEDIVPAAERASAAEAEDIAMSSEAEEAPPLSAPAEELPSAAAVQVETHVQVAAPAPVVEAPLADAEVTQIASADSTVAMPAQADTSGNGPSSAETRTATLARPRVVSIGPAAKIGNKKPSKKRAAAVVRKPPATLKKPAAAKQVLVRRKVAPRPRIARPAPPQPAAPFASPFGGWDNQGAASGRAGKTAFGF